MPQPDHADAADRSVHPDTHAELDPLLAFNAELAAAEPLEKPANPPPVASSLPAADPEPLKPRLDQAERSLDRALTEIATLKSDLATLVGAVDDIKKRLSRRLEPAPVPAPVVVKARSRAFGRRFAAVVVLLAALGLAAWGVISLTTIEEPGPPPIEAETSAVPVPPAPVAVDPAVVAPASQVALQTVARVAPPPRIRRDPPRPAAPAIGYVGTLSIDAAPGGQVFINRKAAGTTPLRVEKLRAGSHLIWIERAGYRRWTRVVAVASGRVSRVWADLEPLNR